MAYNVANLALRGGRIAQKITVEGPALRGKDTNLALARYPGFRVVAIRSPLKDMTGLHTLLNVQNSRPGDYLMLMHATRIPKDLQKAISRATPGYYKDYLRYCRYVGVASHLGLGCLGIAVSGVGFELSSRTGPRPWRIDRPGILVGAKERDEDGKLRNISFVRSCLAIVYQVGILKAASEAGQKSIALSGDSLNFFAGLYLNNFIFSLLGLGREMPTGDKNPCREQRVIMSNKVRNAACHNSGGLLVLWKRMPDEEKSHFTGISRPLSLQGLISGQIDPQLV